MSERKRWGLGRKLLLQLVLIPVLLLIGDQAYRAFGRADREPLERTRLKLINVVSDTETPLAGFHLGQAANGKDLVRVPSPFYAWEFDADIPDLATLTEYFASPEGRDTYDILILGGSVAAAFAGQGGGRLAEVLRRDPRFKGRRIRVIGKARGGWKQPQQLNYLIFVLGLGWEPDAVISLDGFNEVAIGNQNASLRAYPLYPSVPHWGHLVVLGRMGDDEFESMWQLREAKSEPRRIKQLYERWGLGHSALLSDATLDRATAAQARYTKAHGSYQHTLGEFGREAKLYGPPLRSNGTEERMRLAVDAWASASKSMQAICDQSGIFFVHVLQPTLHDEGSKRLTKKEVRKGACSPEWSQAVIIGYPMLREAGRGLRAAGVNFVGGSMAFEGVRQALYYDACHFVEEGNEILAEFVGARFLETLPTD